MQVLDEEDKAYYNFINSLNSESTGTSYKLCLKEIPWLLQTWFIIIFKVTTRGNVKLYHKIFSWSENI